MRLPILALILAAFTAAPVAAQEERTITVSGEGGVAAVPDMATIRLGVTTEAGTAAEALAANSEAMQGVMAALTAEGLAERDVQTASINLSPRYADRMQDGRPEVTVYVARNTVTARVRDIDRVGAILDAVAGAGANTFEGLSFGLQEPRSLQEEALRLAVDDARRKAELLAEEAGTTLGQLQSIDAANAAREPVQMAEMRMAADSVPVAQGELEIGASIRAVWTLATE